MVPPRGTNPRILMRNALNNSPGKINRSSPSKENKVINRDGEEKKEGPTKAKNNNGPGDVAGNLDHDSSHSNEIQKKGTIFTLPPAPSILPSAVSRRLTREDEFKQIILNVSENPHRRMASRNNRPRASFAKPEQGAAAQEEMNMWERIKADMMRANTFRKQSDEKMRLYDEAKERIGNLKQSATNEQLQEMLAMAIEGNRLVEEEKKILREEPCDLLKNFELFRALRAASELEPRSAPSIKVRNQKSKIRGDTDGASDSPGPTHIKPLTADAHSYPDVIKEVDAGFLSGSTAAGKDVKESPVKTEEGSEGGKGPAEKAGKLFVGAEVAYKQVKMKDDGSQWIQCIVKSITEVGNKKRYEVQDPEPDDTGAPGQIYKTSAANLIAIPSSDAILAEYSVGKQVLARYPETTTFYHAEVTGMKKDICRLKFEDDQNQEMEVARRFVLELNTK